MFEKLPAKLRFWGRTGASIYMPGRITPVVVRGYGHLTLSFESTDRPGFLSIGVRDLCWRFAPFSIPLDVDRDGQYECIELHNIELNMNHLNGEASRGTLSTFGVARPGADHAVLSAELVAPLQRPVLGFAEPRRHCVAMRPAGILPVNRKSPARAA